MHNARPGTFFLHKTWNLFFQEPFFCDHRHAVAKETFGYVDHKVWSALWQWAARRHPNKSAKWVKAKYFKTVGARNWVFAAKVNAPDGKPMNLTLATASDTVIRRHVKIKSTANPFDSKDEIYFENRLDWKLKESPTGKKKLARLGQSEEVLSCMPTTFRRER
jgi:RNA-directed DNA polymerase